MLTGNFDPLAPNGDGSFSVLLTGEGVLYEYGEEVSRERSAVVWQIFPNAGENRWEVHAGGRLLSLLDYRSAAPNPEEDDESIETPIYQFPSLTQCPDYPRGEIHVRRETVRGASQPQPFWIQIDESKISFSAPGDGGE